MRVLYTAAAFLVSFAVTAQTVLIKSGQHGNASRAKASGKTTEKEALSRIRVHEHARDVLEAARDLEDATWEFQRGRGEAEDLKRDIRRVFRELSLLDRQLPGESVLPDPYLQQPPELHGPLPKTIDFGQTPELDTASATLHPKQADPRPISQLHFQHLGGSRYLRIREIEILTRDNKTVKASQLLSRSLYEKVYAQSTYTLTLKTPLYIQSVTVSISHETAGVRVWGTPAAVAPVQGPHRGTWRGK